MKNKMNWLLPTLLMLCLMVTPFAMAEGSAVEIIGETIAQTTDDLIVDYAYPTFKTDDAALAEALDAKISQACLDQYQALCAEYEEFAADRTQDQMDAYKKDADYRDELMGEYQILANNGRFIQIVTPTRFQPAGGNGDWGHVQSYVFDVKGLQLLTPENFFTDPAEDVYAALNQVVTERLPSLEGAYDEADTTVSAATPFYFNEEGNAIHLLFNPYELSKEDQEIIVPVESLPLTLADLDALPVLDGGNGMIGMPNPMREATAAEIEAAIGVQLKLPEGATDVAYFLYDLGDGTMAEAQFVMDGTAYTYRAQPGEAADIAGMYVDFATEQEAKVGEMPATLKLNDGAEGVCLWHDSEAGMAYSLAATDGANADALLALANALAE